MVCVFLMYKSFNHDQQPPPPPQPPGNLTFDNISSQRPAGQAESTVKCPAIGVHGSTTNSTKEFVSTAFQIVFPSFQALNNSILLFRIKKQF